RRVTADRHAIMYVATTKLSHSIEGPWRTSLGNRLGEQAWRTAMEENNTFRTVTISDMKYSKL
ncbi:hypothetical protein Hamer_G026735, partial [Homarus americanus]